MNSLSCFRIIWLFEYSFVIKKLRKCLEPVSKNIIPTAGGGVWTRVFILGEIQETSVYGLQKRILRLYVFNSIAYIDSVGGKKHSLHMSISCPFFLHFTVSKSKCSVERKTNLRYWFSYFRLTRKSISGHTWRGKYSFLDFSLD